jgi:hypothetical protein
MVRVQLKPNDIRSYRRADVEEVLKATPGAFIVGEQAEDEESGTRLEGTGSTFEEAAEDLKTKASAKAQRSAPNKARTTKPAKSKTPPADPPSSTPPDQGQTGSSDPSATEPKAD